MTYDDEIFMSCYASCDFCQDLHEAQSNLYAVGNRNFLLKIIKSNQLHSNSLSKELLVILVVKVDYSTDTVAISLEYRKYYSWLLRFAVTKFMFVKARF